MAHTKNREMWLDNIGEIMIAEDGEFFWILPQIFVFDYEYSVASPYFSFDQENWRLVMMPSDGEQPCLSKNDYVGLFLWMKGCYDLEQKYNIRLAVKTSDGKDEVCFDSGELDSFYGFGTWDYMNVREDAPDDICQSGRIKIRCVIERKEDTASVKEENENETVNTKFGEQKNAPESKGVIRLVQNFKNLLNDDVSTDVVLKTNDHKFRAHRIILGARSPVFSSMFQHDMAEKRTGEVDISDCSTAGFNAFLQYLYSGNTDTMSPNNVLDLYYIADKYQVSDLKSDCVNYMKSSLAIYNICDIITLSLKHNESDLRSFAIRFFGRNIKKIVKTTQWQKYITENPIQANELFIKAINA